MLKHGKVHKKSSKSVVVSVCVYRSVSCMDIKMYGRVKQPYIDRARVKMGYNEGMASDARVC